MGASASSLSDHNGFTGRGEFGLAGMGGCNVARAVMALSSCACTWTLRALSSYVQCIYALKIAFKHTFGYPNPVPQHPTSPQSC